MVVSPTVNQTAPIKSLEDERLASSQTTSRRLESTKGSSPQEEEPSPQGEEGDRLEVGSLALLYSQNIVYLDLKGVGAYI